MKTLFLLIMLTQNGAGDINAAFVNTETLEQCQQKAMMVEGVFQASAIPVIESRCIKSELKFSKFGHASTSSKIKSFYLIHFDRSSVQISPVSDWRACMDRQKDDVKQGRLYCSSSVQSLDES
jgi:hypothetical protein